MKFTRFFMGALGLSVIAIACGIAFSEDADPIDIKALYIGEYIGTWTPPRSNCGSCHAKASIHQDGSKYLLEVKVDYAPQAKRCSEHTRTIKLPGKPMDKGLVFESKKYRIHANDAGISGRRLYGKKIPRSVIGMKKSPKLRLEISCEKPTLKKGVDLTKILIKI